MSKLLNSVSALVVCASVGMFSASASADAVSGLKRVIVVTDQGGLPESLKAKALEAFSRSFQRAAILNLSKNTVGLRISEGDAARPMQAAGLIARTLYDADSLMREEVWSDEEFAGWVSPGVDNERPNIGRHSLDGPAFPLKRIPVGLKYQSDLDKLVASAPTGKLEFEVLTVPTDVDLPPPASGSLLDAVRRSGISLAEAMLNASYIAENRETKDIGLLILQQSEGLAVVDGEKAEELGLWSQARQAYEVFAADPRTAFMPYQVGVSLSFGGGKMTARMRTLIRPTTLAQSQGPANTTGNFTDRFLWARQLTYAPEPSLKNGGNSPAAMTVSLENTYGPGKQDPMVKVQFGILNIIAPDFTAPMLAICNVDCTHALPPNPVGLYYPTIVGEFRFQELALLDAVLAANSGGLVTSRTIAETLGRKDRFFILIQTLAIRFNPAHIEVLPDKSVMTFAVGEGNKAIQMSHTTPNVFGFDAFSKIAPKLAGRFTEKFNASFQKVDGFRKPGDPNLVKTNGEGDSVMRSLKPLVDLFF